MAIANSAPLTARLAALTTSPRGHRDRGVVALLLEKAHVGGDHGRVAAGQGGEGGGHLEPEGTAKGQ
jgi:hypothetical protein